MQHFDITQWTDYVRGLTAPAERDAMERHILDGCEACTKVVGLLTRVHREAVAEPEVPEPLVREAKAVFPARRAAAKLPDWMSWPRLALQFVSNPLAGALPAGARAVPDATAQIRYHAGDYSIDLQIEREPETAELALIGQVVNRADAGRPVAGAPVVLAVRSRLVASGKSNRFGEFCLVSRVQQGLKFCMQAEPFGKRVEIPLARIMGGRL
jgi:hypothetical protein